MVVSITITQHTQITQLIIWSSTTDYRYMEQRLVCRYMVQRLMCRYMVQRLMCRYMVQRLVWRYMVQRLVWRYIAAAPTTILTKSCQQIHELIPEPEQQPEDWNEMEQHNNESVLLPNQLPGNIIRATRDLQGNKSWLL